MFKKKNYIGIKPDKNDTKIKRILIVIIPILLIIIGVVLFAMGGLNKLMGNSVTADTNNTISIEFNPNGGSGSMTPQTVEINSTDAVKKNTFKGPYNDSNFFGWAIYNKRLKKYLWVFYGSTDSHGNVIDDDKEKRYYYDDSFIYNMGNKKQVEEIAIIKDCSSLSSIINGLEKDFEFVRPGDTLVLIAMWEGKRTINFDSNGATSGYMYPIEISTLTTTISLPNCDYYKDGYKFDGWKIYDNDTKKWVTTVNTEVNDPNDLSTTFHSFIDEPLISDYLYFNNKIGQVFTIYPQWKSHSIPLTIMYDANGGIGSIDVQNAGDKASDSTFQFYKNTIIKANNGQIVRTGYTFKGWNVYTYKSDSKYYDIQKCDKKYLELSVPNVECSITNALILRDGGTLAYIPYGSSVLLKAVWEKNNTSSNNVSGQYTVYYKTNSNTSINNQIVNYNEYFNLSNITPKKQYYKFAGYHALRNDNLWYCYTNSNKSLKEWKNESVCKKNGYVKFAKGEKLLKLVNVNESVTMYAQWELNSFTVNYSATGVTGIMGSQTIEYGKSTSLRLNNFKKNGYIFDGWYAQRQNGTWLCYTDPGKQRTAWTNKNTCNNFGYVKYNDGEKVAQTAPVGTSVTMHAQWKSSQFTVKYYSGGGTGTMSDQKITYGVSTKLFANKFTRSGYNFIGWHAQRDDGTWLCYTDPGKQRTEWMSISKCNFGYVIYSNQEYVAKTANPGRYVKMVAQWKTNSFTVRYDANGGYGSMSEQKIIYGVPTKLKSNSFSKSGYKFKEWYAKKGNEWLCYTDPSHQNSTWMVQAKCSFGKDPYSNGAKVAKTVPAGQVVTMYAVWKKNACSTEYYCTRGSIVGSGPTAYCHEKLYEAKKTVYKCEKGFTKTKDGYCVYSATYLYTDKWNRKIYANCNSSNGEWLDGNKCKKAAKRQYGSNKESCPKGGIRDGAYCYNEYNTSKRQVCN